MDTGTEKLKAKIKPGTYDGIKLSVKAKNKKGRGGQDGNLDLTIKVQTDSVYKHKGNNLYMENPVDLFNTLLGGKQEVQTHSGGK